MLSVIFSLLGVGHSYFSGKMNRGGNVKFPRMGYISDPENDLYKITNAQASTITKYWSEILKVSVPQSGVFETTAADYKKYRVDSYSHLYEGVNDFERYLNYHRSDEDMYLSWQPKKRSHKFAVTLFIVAAEIDPLEQLFKINMVLQSPMWKDSRDISSLELKKALENVNEKANCTKIDYSPMKKTNLRFYWSWFPPGVVSK